MPGVFTAAARAAKAAVDAAKHGAAIRKALCLQKTKAITAEAKEACPFSLTEIPEFPVAAADMLVSPTLTLRPRCELPTVQR